MCTDAKPRENWELSLGDISQEYVHSILSFINSDVQVEHAKKAGTVCLFYSIVLTKGIFKWDFILAEILILNIWFQNKERNAISRQQATDGAERKGKTKVTAGVQARSAKARNVRKSDIPFKRPRKRYGFW